MKTLQAKPDAIQAAAEAETKTGRRRMDVDMVKTSRHQPENRNFLQGWANDIRLMRMNVTDVSRMLFARRRTTSVLTCQASQNSRKWTKINRNKQQADAAKPKLDTTNAAVGVVAKHRAQMVGTTVVVGSPITYRNSDEKPQV